MPSGTRRSVRLACGTSTCSAWAPWSEPSVRPWPNTRPSSHLWKSPRRQKKQVPQAEQKQPEHAVALGRLGDRLARGDDRPHELVTEREAGLDLDAAVVDVQVGAADAGGLDANDRVVALDQLGLRPLLQPDLAGRLECDCLHGARHGTGG